MDLILVRHGEPDPDEAKTTPDPGLSLTGHDQAAAMAEFLASEPIDAIYSSTMARACQTAAPLEAALGLTAATVADLREWDADEVVYRGGVPVSQVPQDIVERFRNGLDDAEGHAFRDRVTAAIEDIIANHRGQTVAVVCHGGVISAYLCHLANGTRPAFVSVGHSSLTRIMAASNGFRSIHSVSEMPHLPRANPQPGQGYRN